MTLSTITSIIKVIKSILESVKTVTETAKTLKTAKDFCLLHINASKYKKIAENREATEQSVKSPTETSNSRVLLRKSVPKDYAENLNDENKYVLSELAKYDRPLSVPDIQQLLAIPANVISYHIDVLLKNDLIEIYNPKLLSTRDVIANHNKPTRYTVSPEGIAYLANNNEK